MEGRRGDDRDRVDPSRGDGRARDGLAARLGPGRPLSAGRPTPRAYPVVCGLGALALLGAGTLGCGESTTALTLPPPAAGDNAVVKSVGDGDSLRLTDGRSLRVLQIDAPELHGDCYGKEALLALRRLAPPGAQVTIAADPALDRVDTYGRVLRYVFAGKRNVGLELVRAGAASPYFFRREKGRYSAQLLAAAKEARSERRGFWGACPGARLEPNIGSVTGRG